MRKLIAALGRGWTDYLDRSAQGWELVGRGPAWQMPPDARWLGFRH